MSLSVLKFRTDTLLLSFRKLNLSVVPILSLLKIFVIFDLILLAKSDIYELHYS